MRRLVAAFIMVMVAASLAACSGSTPDTAATDPAATAPAATAPAASVPTPSSDSLSPTESVGPDDKFPNDPAQTPQAVLDRLAAKQPMLIFYFDSKTNVTKDQRVEIDKAMKSYRGLIDLLLFDTRAGLPTTDPSTGKPAVVPSETAKAALMSSVVGIRTTPYLIFVDRYGRISYRFMGYVDAGLIEREILRATQ
ncbi:MAG: hypothetical protein Q7W30_09940 [Coriobacteriia bacterium]|nr:hypothetical protein [Coriobacteriia bacterium]